MSDLLAAASLLLTLLGIIYGQWYPDIMAAQDAPVPLQLADRTPVQRKIRAALWGKTLPLLAATGILAIIFLPNASGIALPWLAKLASKPLDAFTPYAAVEVAFCFVELLSIALTIHITLLAHTLWSKLRKTKL